MTTIGYEHYIFRTTEKLDYKTLSSLDRTCTSLRGIVDYTWGVFRKRDGLNFEFEIAQGKSNADKYLLSYAVLDNLTKSSPKLKITQKLLLSFESIYRLLSLNRNGVKGAGLGSNCPVYSDIKLAAGKFTGDSLLYAQSTPIKGNENEILEHYTKAFNHGISAVSEIAWGRFSHIFSQINGQLNREVPVQLENLVILGSGQGDCATLSNLLKVKPSLIELDSIQHYYPVLVLKADKAYAEGNIPAAIQLYEAAMAASITTVPREVLLNAANACRMDDTSLKRAADLYELVIAQRRIGVDGLNIAAEVNIKLGNYKGPLKFL